MNHEETQALLEAYVDEQLEIADTLRVETHLAECESCRAWLNERRVLRARIHAAPLRYRMPPGLAAGIHVQAVPPRCRTFDLQWPGALAAGLLLGLTGLWAGHLMTVRRTAADAWVGAYVRSNLSARSTDVLSSDHHTVKPWLSARLPYSPPVPEMTGATDALLGARIDYIERTAVAALVYQHGKHQIDVFVWPEGERPDPAITAAPTGGFRVTTLQLQNFNAVFVSDMNAAELAEFRERWGALAAAM